MRTRIIILLLGVSIPLVGCGKGEKAADTAAAAPAATPAAASGGMESMPGMGSMPAGGSPAADMQAHMEMMRKAGPDSMKAMMAGHRQMAANLIAEYSKQMRDMNMAADAAWTATVDSLRADLRMMPDRSAAEMQAQMPAHEARLMRLTQMHQAMMKNMK